MTGAAEADARLVARVLEPYRENCRYLRGAELVETPDKIAARGRFGISESCYIDDTGHFNAVEFNICYNQLGYYLIAKCVEDELFPQFSEWSMDDFWKRQLSNVLIYKFSSRFKGMIDPRSFEGEVSFREPVISDRPGRPSVMFVETSCSFRDDAGGFAEGEVTLAFTDLP
ncbi:FcoT family thioesterase [Streptomyces mirabilis]|uniref:FcoT family thioesterase n=1 Tax=Streptomyces mirabilis TaxID=68239 RepID=UPI00367F5337